MTLLVLGGMELDTALRTDPPASAEPQGGASSGAPGACDPLVPFACALPFPSSFYMRDDPTSLTGKRVDLKGSAPATRWVTSDTVASQLGANGLSQHDGFSTVAPVLFAFVHPLCVAPLCCHSRAFRRLTNIFCFIT